MLYVTLCIFIMRLRAESLDLCVPYANNIG